MDTLQVVLDAATPTAEELAGFEVGDTLPYPRALARSLRMEEAFGQRVFYDVAAGRIARW